jgi:RimJ/RimL family protein N-acetyltransferase
LITFKRSWDTALVRSIITHPKLFRHFMDDASPRPEDWHAPHDERCWYVLAWDDDELLGLFVLIEGDEAWSIHVCLLPSAWGETALRASRAISRWVFTQTAAPRLTCAIRADNRLSLQLAKRSGFRECGTLPASWLSGGVRHDQIRLSLDKDTKD